MVKLWQYDMEDRSHIRIDTNKMRFIQESATDHKKIMPLFDDGKEYVRLETLEADKNISYKPEGGLEIFVLEGGFHALDQDFQKWSWLRLPAGTNLTLTAGPAGAKIWVKEGHLNHYTSAPNI